MICKMKAPLIFTYTQLSLHLKYTHFSLRSLFSLEKFGRNKIWNRATNAAHILILTAPGTTEHNKCKMNFDCLDWKLLN